MMGTHTKTIKIVNLIVGSLLLLGIHSVSYAEEQTYRAILLNSIQGAHSQAQPADVKLLITSGEAKGCTVQGQAYLNRKRLRYEFNLAPIECIKDGQKIRVGQIVRGQHNIKGTMANSGMGRNYLVTNKGVAVTLAHR